MGVAEHRAPTRKTVIAPERVLYPDTIGLAILRECHGARSVAEIAAHLAMEFEAPVAEIQQDVIDLLQGLADSGYVVVEATA